MTATASSAHCVGALDQLLAIMGLDAAAGGGRIEITGADPVVDSRHRPGEAAAAALAAQGLAIAAIWRMRGGEGQDISVDMRRATHVGLRTINHIRQNGVAHELYPRSSTGLSDFYPTRDGRLIFVLRGTLFIDSVLRALSLLDCAYEREDMARAIARRDGEELEEAMAERRVVGTMVRSRDEWLARPQGRLLASMPPIAIEKIGDSPPMPFGPGERPLSGIRVLDFTHVLAGPVASRTLAEQGADVLHLCAQHQPDPVRLNIDTGLGKRSALLDVDRPEERDRLMALLGDADIFVQSWRPSSLHVRGLDAEHLAEARPGLIYVSVSCYGSDGPWSDRAGYEPCGQIACGLVADEGSMQEPRFAVTGTLNDYLAAYLAVCGALSALIRRAEEGGSYHVKVSLTRTSMWMQELGRLPREIWPEGEIDMPALPSDLLQMDSAFGRITVPAPITQYSRTAAYWARPPQPFGASTPSW